MNAPASFWLHVAQAHWRSSRYMRGEKRERFEQASWSCLLRWARTV